MSARVQVYCGCSLDGFIAGLGDDLSWLPEVSIDGEPGFPAFLAGVGAMLMGRRTWDFVAGFGEDHWWYGDLPIRVATSRPIDSPRPTVRATQGPIEHMVAEARALAGEKNVYLDGGSLIRSALDAGLVDDVTLTVVPIILGQGVPLFAGANHRRPLHLAAVHQLPADMVQLRYRL